MLLIKISFSVIVASLTIASLPAFAEGTNMESNQTTIIDGSGNYAGSTNNQSINSTNNGKNSSGVSMKNRQVCDIVGNNNTCVNQNTQRVDNRRYYRR